MNIKSNRMKTISALIAMTLASAGFAEKQM